jgi:hypothetical protein
MIGMPRRSVTRFFIPLIDVLLLLFCVFLLMPMVNEEELDQAMVSATELNESNAVLDQELDRRTQELSRFEDLRPQLVELEKLREEIERLRKERKEGAERIAFKILDLDREDGALYSFDPLQPDKGKRKIADEKAAHQLIEEHKREAKGQELYYYFLYPRVESGFPTRQQAKEYANWFSQVPNSLKRKETVP